MANMEEQKETEERAEHRMNAGTTSTFWFFSFDWVSLIVL